MRDLNQGCLRAPYGSWAPSSVPEPLPPRLVLLISIQACENQNGKVSVSRRAVILNSPCHRMVVLSGTHTTSLWSPRCHGEFIARNLCGKSTYYQPWSRAGSTDRLGRGEGRGRSDVAPSCSLSNASRYCWQGVHPKPCSRGEGLSLQTGQRIPWENCFRLPLPELHCICCTQSRGKERRRRKFVLRTFFRAGVRVIVCQMGNLYAGQCFSLNTVLFSSHNLLSLAWYL